MKYNAIAVVLMAAVLVLGCTKKDIAPPADENVLRAFSPGTDKPIATDAVKADGDEWVISVDEAQSVRLFEFPVKDFNAGRIEYIAQAKAEGVFGAAYLEMWVRLPGKGEFFSKAMDTPLKGESGWSTYSAPFFFQEGQIPESIRLQLTFVDKGTVRMRNVRVTQTAGE